jgi:hypothetical protein
MSRGISRRRLLGAGGAAALVPLALPTHAGAAAMVGGTVVTLVTPVRVLDTRQASSPLGGAKLQPGNNVGFPIGSFLDGAIAEAAFINVTVTGTENAGFLTVFPSDLSGTRPIPATSNVNWWGSGLTLANSTLTAVGGETYIVIRCSGSGGTHVIVDLQGYIPFVPV